MNNIDKKNNESLVSIITPTYNSEKFLDDSIKSVLGQSYTNWEMIIIDDFSEDNTQDVVKKYSDNDFRIKYFRLSKNCGAAVSRNEAIKRATGDFIAFLDSDDIWQKDKLKKQIEFMKNNNYAFTCTAYSQIDVDGNDLNKLFSVKKKANYNDILLSNPVGNSTVIYNKKYIGKIVIPDIRKRNDDALWLKILKVEKYIYGLPEVLVKYRVRRDSISSNKISLIKYHWILYRDIEHLSVFKSLYHIAIWIIIKITRIK